MHVLRKINRGLIFSAIVLVTVLILTSVSGAVRRRAEPDLRDLAQRYMQAELPFLALPARLMPEPGRAPTEAAMDTFEEEAERALAPFYTRNPDDLTHTLRRLRAGWRSQRAAWTFTGAQFDESTWQPPEFATDAATVNVILKLAVGSSWPQNLGSGMNQLESAPQNPGNQPATGVIFGFRRVSGAWVISFMQLQLGSAYPDMPYGY